MNEQQFEIPFSPSAILQPDYKELLVNWYSVQGGLTTNMNKDVKYVFRMAVWRKPSAAPYSCSGWKRELGALGAEGLSSQSAAAAAKAQLPSQLVLYISKVQILWHSQNADSTEHRIPSKGRKNWATFTNCKVEILSWSRLWLLQVSAVGP